VKVGVVGLGLIGGSLLRALGGVGYDADPAVRAAASAEGFEVAEALDGLRGEELVFVAVPPAITYEVVDDVLAAVPGAMVADTASVKGTVPERERFVSAHPMAGAETSGWAASSAELLRGATWAACPSDPAIEPLLALATAVDALGGRVVTCTPESHDAAVARTSHVPHVVANALAALAPDTALAGTAFRDMTRVAHSDAVLWSQILAANRAAVEPALDELIARLAEFRAMIGDEPSLREMWARTAHRREPEWRDEAIVGHEALYGRAVRRLRLEGGALRAEVAR
jgi:prephenate dehydrogenase